MDQTNTEQPTQLQSKEEELSELKEVQEQIESTLDKELTNPEGKTKKIRDIILKGDSYIKGDKLIFRHGGILRMMEFVNAELLDPEPITPRLSDNFSAFVFYCPVKFPDGEISRWGIGEANEQNTQSFGKNYKANQAVIRGAARSFLHSKNIGLYDVYSEGEADDFNKQVSHIEELNRRIHLLERQIGNLKIQKTNLGNANETTSIQLKLTKEIVALPTPEQLTLPEDDKHYPGESIISVLCNYRDFEYVKFLQENLPSDHPIRILFNFLTEKAQADKRNKNRYNLYSTALELLKELKLIEKNNGPEDNTIDTPSIDTEQMEDAILEEPGNDNPVDNDNVTTSQLSDTVESNHEIINNTDSSSQQEKKTNESTDNTSNNEVEPAFNSFLNELDAIIDLEEISQNVHPSTETENETHTEKASETKTKKSNSKKNDVDSKKQASSKKNNKK